MSSMGTNSAFTSGRKDDQEIDYFIERAKGDAIIIGCGARPVMPPIPGIDGDFVVSILDFHRDPSCLKSDTPVVCGGGASGLDGALELASEMGKKVTVIEMLPQCGKDVFFINQITLFCKLAEAGV